MYLIDSSIVDALGRAAPGHQRLRDWLGRASDRLYLSVVSVAEIESRIPAAARRDHALQARTAGWVDLLQHLYGDRLLPLDLKTARLTGQLLETMRRKGSAARFEDAAVAATASLSGFTILSRLPAPLRPMDVASIDPFDALPEL